MDSYTELVQQRLEQLRNLKKRQEESTAIFQETKRRKEEKELKEALAKCEAVTMYCLETITDEKLIEGFTVGKDIDEYVAEICSQSANTSMNTKTVQCVVNNLDCKECYYCLYFHNPELYLSDYKGDDGVLVVKKERNGKQYVTPHQLTILKETKKLRIKCVHTYLTQLLTPVYTKRIPEEIEVLEKKMEGLKRKIEDLRAMM